VAAFLGAIEHALLIVALLTIALGVTRTAEMTMDIDTEKVDAAVLAVLYLTLHQGGRAWKGVDWDALARLHEKGLIHDPVGKQKSVVFTDEGLREAERCFRELFAKR
jgi:hypothetical protein